MSKNRSVIRVVPNQGNWSVKQGNRTISNHRKKETAIEIGRKTAKKQLPAQLVIHKKNGEIQTEYTYSDDPFPPEG
jgi:hypothetical protein